MSEEVIEANVNEGIEVEVPPQEEWHGKQPSCLGIHISGSDNDMITILLMTVKVTDGSLRIL